MHAADDALVCTCSRRYNGLAHMPLHMHLVVFEVAALASRSAICFCFACAIVWIHLLNWLVSEVHA